MSTILLAWFNLLIALLFSIGVNISAKTSDVIVFDFESGDFAGWTVSGANPFVGGKPIHKSQMEHWKRGPVGYTGNYYLESGGNEGRHDNHADGTLISPEFVISRNYLNFYLAGELHPNVRVYLLVEGAVVREAFGNNFYDLQLRGWNVEPFRRKKARFCIQDSTSMRSLLRLDHVFLSNTAPPPPSSWVNIDKRETSTLVAPGEFKLIFREEAIGDKTWRISHSGIVRGHDGRWHLFASAFHEKDLWRPENHQTIIHASAGSLTDTNWQFEGQVFRADSVYGEQFLWDPYVLFHNGLYYLFYVGAGHPWSGWYAPADGKPEPWYGGQSGDQGPYWMYLATSKDGKHWQRIGTADKVHPGAIFTEKPFAFHPYVTRVGEQWVMYYASATNQTVYSQHAIGYRTSQDLVHWSSRKLALTDWQPGDSLAPADNSMKPASPWPEHSFFRYPLVLNRGPVWYMFAGPIDNNNLSRYHVLRLYRSTTPFSFTNHREALEQNKRIFVDGGAKILQDTDGKWYITTGNDMAGGVWLAPLYWNDGHSRDPDTKQKPGR